MKKRYILLTAILVLAALACAACTKLTPMEQISKYYEETANATKIEQKIEIKKGSMLQYESTKTYSKQDSGYLVTGTEKTLNSLTAETPYIENTINETMQGNAEIVAALKLDESYFGEDLTIDGNGLTASVKSEHVKDVLTLTDSELAAQVDNMKLSVTVSDAHLTALTITYDSGESDVTITLAYTYAE